MNIQEIIFSPTGGTKKAADAITAELCIRFHCEKKIIDLTDSTSAFETMPVNADDIVLIAVPSYGGRVPVPASERIKKIKGNGAKTSIVCVYGNRAYDDTLIELHDLAQEAGFQTEAAVAAIAEHSIARKYASGRPDAEDIKELSSFADQSAEKIQQNIKNEFTIPGNRPYKETSSGGLVPKTSKACTECGLCAAQCPVQAIDVNDPKSVDAKKCISCMRCVSICPVKARRINPAMGLAVQAALKKACSARKKNEIYL